MYNRRYQSLQRSFRSAHHQRRDPTHNLTENLSPIESVGAISYIHVAAGRRTSESGAQRESMHTGDDATAQPIHGGKSKGKGKGWFSFGRKGKQQRVVQQRSSSMDNDNMLHVTTSPDPPFSPLSPPPSVDELLDSNSYREDTRETSVEREGARYTSDEGDMVVGSMDLEQFGGSDDDVREESRGAVVSPITAITGSEHAEQNRESSPAAVTLRSEREGPLVPNPQRIRFGSRSDRRQRNRGGADTDEETDVVLSQRNSLASPDHEIDRELERERERAKEQDRDQPSAKSKGSKKKSVSKGLLKSPGLKFITRPDLYSFLNTAGVSTGEMRAVPYSRLSLLSSFLLTGSW